MSKIALIHGFGAGINYSIFQKTESSNAGFVAFDDLIAKEKAKVFDWRISRNLNLVQVLSVFPILKIYWQEKAKSQSEKIQNQLKIFLESNQPKIIICHSMGAMLLFGHNYKLPISVKKIVLIQADISSNAKIPKNLQKLEIINYFCPWDNALLGSNFLNLNIMAGQIGLKGATNIFFPLLLNNLNMHTFPLRSNKFFKKIEALLD